MNAVDTRTLLLSQGYEPIKVISWRRAIALILGRGILEDADGLREACQLLFGEDADRRFVEYFAADPLAQAAGDPNAAA